MLSINLLRSQPQWVKEQLQRKNFTALHLVDQILQADIDRRASLTEQENMQAQLNKLSKEIGQKMTAGQQSEAQALKEETQGLKEKIQQVQTAADAKEKEQHDYLLQLPNLPHVSVPLGKSPNENEIVRQSKHSLEATEGSLPHWELAEKYNLIDFELGTKITGAGFPVYIGQGAKLQRALINYFLDQATQAGYNEHQCPLVVNADSAYGTGQLPDKEGQMYHSPTDDFYLIPTAEVPLTNIYRNVIVPETQLPIKLCGYTPCFRREAGSYGKDVRGLNRLHQFDKVEIVQISNPNNSYEILEQMVNHVETLIQSLDLPYRILRLCGGDMSFASALTFDFEVYSKAQQRWLEVSSVSNFETFQSQRLKLRYKDNEGKNQVAHTLNGSALALPRIVAALLENHQSSHGIAIPACLVPYTGFDIIN